MKICIFIHNLNNLVGGAEKSTLMLAGLLHANGHEVEIITYDRVSGEPYFQMEPMPRICNLYESPKPKRQNNSTFENGEIVDGLFTSIRKHMQVKISFMRRLSLVRRKRKLARLIEQKLETERPDLIISAMPAMTIALSICKNIDAIPKIFVCHTEPIRDLCLDTTSVRDKVSGMHLMDALQKFDGCVVLNEAFKQQIEEKVGFKIAVIPNAIDQVDFPTSTPSLVSGRKPVIVYIGRLEPIKRPMLLLEAWKLVVEKAPHWSLQIYGDGSLNDEMANFIDKHQLNDSCAMMGFTRDVCGVYRNARLSCLPSSTEGHPISMVESMACGTVGIGMSDCPGLVALLSDCGFLAEEPTPQALADAILEAMNSPLKLEEKAGQGYQKSLEYRGEVVGNMWENFFVEMGL